jgi:hypothetical protein
MRREIPPKSPGCTGMVARANRFATSDLGPNRRAAHVGEGLSGGYRVAEQSPYKEMFLCLPRLTGFLWQRGFELNRVPSIGLSFWQVPLPRDCYGQHEGFLVC